MNKKIERETIEKAIESIDKAILLQGNGRHLADKMIEMMKKYKANLMAKERAYRNLKRALRGGNKNEIQIAKAMLEDVPTLKINL